MRDPVYLHPFLSHSVVPHHTRQRVDDAGNLNHADGLLQGRQQIAVQAMGSLRY